jgi:hypothetical protein
MANFVHIIKIQAPIILENAVEICPKNFWSGTRSNETVHPMGELHGKRKDQSSRGFS